jgi:hypothetical protein
MYLLSYRIHISLIPWSVPSPFHIILFFFFRIAHHKEKMVKAEYIPYGEATRERKVVNFGV